MAEDPIQQQPATEPGRTPYLPLAIAFVIIFAVIGYLIYSSRTSGRLVNPTPVNPEAHLVDFYASRLAISDVAISRAENMLGGTSTYIDAKLTNNGDKLVTGATVEVTFKDSLGQVVGRETLPVMVITRTEPEVDLAALNVSPLKPGENKTFRVAFEHISQEWNRQLPDMRITTVLTK
jgi:hypothetical protein